MEEFLKTLLLSTWAFVRDSSLSNLENIYFSIHVSAKSLLVILFLQSSLTWTP